MKKLIIVIILSTLSFSKDWLEGHQNPNGKPFTLTFGMNLEQGEETKYIDGDKKVKMHKDGRINITLPIHSLFTIKYSYFNDNGYISAESILTDNHNHNSWSNDHYIGHQNSAHGDNNIWISSIGGELHIPIYKLWEK